MDKLAVSISPHIRKNESIPKIMWTVIACLSPVLILSTALFGWRSLAITAISIVSCVAVEVVCQKIMKRPVRISDGSAVLTGLLMAYVLPPGVSLAYPAVGAVMAIFIGKQLMGGLGYNIFNPALLARAFLMVTFPVAMTSAWIMPTPLADLGIAGDWIAAINGIPDYHAVTSATPLGTLSEHGLQAFHATFGTGAERYGSFFVGYKPGCIGETSGLLLLLGGLFLLWKRYINWQIPVSMLGTIALLTWIFGGDTLFTGDPLMAILSGGAILGAFFMATDYVTSPSNKMSQLVFGAAIGAITVLIRLKGGYPEGVCYAILLMNPLSTVFDGWFKRKRFSPAPEAKPEPKKEIKAEIKADDKPAEKAEKTAEKVEKPEDKEAKKDASDSDKPAEKVEKPEDKEAKKDASDSDKPAEKVEKPEDKEAKKDASDSDKPAEKVEKPEDKEAKKDASDSDKPAETVEKSEDKEAKKDASDSDKTAEADGKSKEADAKTAESSKEAAE